MIDTLGRSIQRHDLITYPVRHRSQMWVNSGTVLEVTPGYIVVAKYNGTEDMRTVRITAGDRVTIAVRGQLLRDLCDIGDSTMGISDGNTLAASDICTI